MQLYNACNTMILVDMPSNSIDSIITDPPYGISFMNHKWDGSVPSISFWQECLRILKPGGYLISACGTRTHHRMTVNIEDAGFEIHDSIAWLYSTGMPHGKNLGYGYHTQLKPAMELFTVAKKPIDGKTIADNFALWGTGGINIQDNMISVPGGETGRFPSNVIHDGSDEIRSLFPDNKGQICKRSYHEKSPKYNGIYSGGKIYQSKNRTVKPAKDNLGNASRFFYCAKPSSTEKNMNLPNGLKNTCTTVKPVELMQHLIKLYTPKGGVVLDPFMGSGTTGVAACCLGYDFIGIEYNSEAYLIASERIKHSVYKPYIEEFLDDVDKDSAETGAF